MINRDLFDSARCALALVLLVCASMTQAAVFTYAAVVYDEGESSDLTLIDQPMNSAPAVSTSSQSYTDSGLAASGYAHSEFGSLHASAVAITLGLSTQTRGQGSAIWIDSITISSPSATGAGFARAYFTLTGGLSSLSSVTGIGSLANSTVAASVSASGSQVLSISGQRVSRNGIIETDEKILGQGFGGVFQQDPTNTLTGRFAFDIPFVFGTPFQLFASLNAFTQAIGSDPNDQASAFSTFGSSGYWGGIDAVKLANGTGVGDYAIVSQAAVDWSQDFTPAPVPVPAALWLLGPALLLLAPRRLADATLNQRRH